MKTLTHKTGVSKGRDTYGYNLVTLTDTETGKHYRQCGGGYDILGAALGDDLQALYPERLNALHKLAEAQVIDGKYQSRREAGRMSSDPYKHYYGLTAYYDAAGNLKKVNLDGSTGFSNVQGIAKAMGLDIQPVHVKNSRARYSTLSHINIIELTGLDKACIDQALYYGQTLRGREEASRKAAELQETVEREGLDD